MTISASQPAASPAEHPEDKNMGTIKKQARLAGFIYLLLVVFGVFSLLCVGAYYALHVFAYYCTPERALFWRL